MKSLLIHLANLLSSIAPVRETFGLRRWLYSAGGIRIGRNTRITAGVRLYDRYIAIGRDCWVGAGTMIYSTRAAEITLGDRVDIGPGVMMVSGDHEPGNSERRAGVGSGSRISVGSGCWIGFGAKILPGAHIGPGCMVAAGAVVLKGEYPANALLAGVPAKIKKIYG